MALIILAGDIGGTNTRLSLHAVKSLSDIKNDSRCLEAQTTIYFQSYKNDGYPYFKDALDAVCQSNSWINSNDRLIE